MLLRSDSQLSLWPTLWPLPMEEPKDVSEGGSSFKKMGLWG